MNISLFHSLRKLKRTGIWRTSNSVLVCRSSVVLTFMCLACLSLPCHSENCPFPIPKLEPPTFPNLSVNIEDHGATAGGKVKSTEAIRFAIQFCSEKGGGTVVVPEGVWLTGAIHLKSHVRLHLERDAVLRFSTDPEDYLPVVFTRWAGFECYNYSPLIYARDCEDIAITGEGEIEGQGETWWPWEERQADTAKRLYETQVLQNVPLGKRIYGTVEDGLRPQLISPIHCKRVLLEGFTIRSPGPFWTVHFVYCDQVIARNLSINTPGGPNTDGLNVDSCSNVLIEHCRFDTGDDCIALKSGINEDGWRVGRPTENVEVRHIETKRGHGGIVFGSDTSGGIRHVFVHNCHFQGTDIGIRLKSTRGRGGVVEDIWLKDIEMNDIAHEAVRINTHYRAWFASNGGKAPLFRNIHMENIVCRGAKVGLKILGLPDQPIENVSLNKAVLQVQKGFELDHVKGLSLTSVQVKEE